MSRMQVNVADVSTVLKLLQQQVEALQQQTERLNKILAYEDQTVVDEEMKVTQLARSRSKSKEPREFTPSELESIRQLFDAFDHDKSGSINLIELKDLHTKLGEPLTDEEAALAIKVIKTKEDGVLQFEEFLQWWRTDHNRSANFEKKFKLLSGDVNADRFDIKRVKVHAFGGPVGTLEYRLGFEYEFKDGELRDISPWHDVPLYHDKSQKHVHFICEIPKWTRAKYEIATKENLNPIKQDVKNGRLRFYQHGDMMFNYGLLPQTWENPEHMSEDTGHKGDNDPIDAVEVGIRQLKTGSITVCKVIGVLAMIDDGETDWKLFIINVNDPLAPLINTPEDLETHLPGAIEAAREYFRIYKVCTGKEPNEFALEEKIMPADYAHHVIEETHGFWNILKNGNKRVLN
jgi:inorganic pyrophosphatase